MSTKSNVSKIEYTKGGGFEHVQRTTADHSPISPFSNPVSVGGIAQVTINVPVPAIAAGATVACSGSMRVVGLPYPLQLGNNASGNVVYTCALITNAPYTAMVIGHPAVTAANNGTSNQTLASGSTTTNTNIQITVNVTAVGAATPSTNLAFLVTVILLGTTS